MSNDEQNRSFSAETDTAEFDEEEEALDLSVKKRVVENNPIEHPYSSNKRKNKPIKASLVELEELKLDKNSAASLVITQTVEEKTSEEELDVDADEEDRGGGEDVAIENEVGESFVEEEMMSEEIDDGGDECYNDDGREEEEDDEVGLNERNASFLAEPQQINDEYEDTGEDEGEESLSSSMMPMNVITQNLTSNFSMQNYITPPKKSKHHSSDNLIDKKLKRSTVIIISIVILN